MARLSSLFSEEQKEGFLKRREFAITNINFEDTDGKGPRVAFKGGFIPEGLKGCENNYDILHAYGIDEVFEREMEQKLLFE